MNLNGTTPLPITSGANFLSGNTTASALPVLNVTQSSAMMESTSQNHATTPNTVVTLGVSVLQQLASSHAPVEHGPAHNASATSASATTTRRGERPQGTTGRSRLNHRARRDAPAATANPTAGPSSTADPTTTTADSSTTTDTPGSSGSSGSSSSPDLSASASSVNLPTATHFSSSVGVTGNDTSNTGNQTSSAGITGNDTSDMPTALTSTIDLPISSDSTTSTTTTTTTTKVTTDLPTSSDKTSSATAPSQTTTQTTITTETTTTACPVCPTSLPLECPDHTVKDVFLALLASLFAFGLSVPLLRNCLRVFQRRCHVETSEELNNRSTHNQKIEMQVARGDVTVQDVEDNQITEDAVVRLLMEKSLAEADANKSPKGSCERVNSAGKDSLI